VTVLPIGTKVSKVASPEFLNATCTARRLSVVMLVASIYEAVSYESYLIIPWTRTKVGFIFSYSLDMLNRSF